MSILFFDSSSLPLGVGISFGVGILLRCVGLQTGNQAFSNKTCYHSYSEKNTKLSQRYNRKTQYQWHMTCEYYYDDPILLTLHFCHPRLFKVMIVTDATECACNFTPFLMTTSRIFSDLCFDLSSFKTLKQGNSGQLSLSRFYNLNRPHHEFYIYACLDTSKSSFIPGAIWKVKVISFLQSLGYSRVQQ